MAGEVRTDGMEAIPPHKWYEVFDKLSRVDDLLELVTKEINLTNTFLEKASTLLEQILARPIEIPPPPPLPAQLSDLLKLVIEGIDETNTLLGKILAKPTEGIAPAPSQLLPNNRSKVHTLGLATANTDKELGIGGIKVNHAVVLKCDSSCTWKRNSKTVDAEDLFVGYSIENYELTELYITNAAGAGQLKVLVEWRE